jgi:hypothetical protein
MPTFTDGRIMDIRSFMIISFSEIERELDALEDQHGFSLGCHLLYSPWGTQESARVAFLSLNPGRASDDFGTPLFI